jgi:peptidoglycan/LPS O-acetylase OafA/YrhL
LNLFRVIACAAVLGQHSFIWANMSGNVVGTGFITMLHLSRNSFFFLTGLVVCYAQITRPRSLLGFWKRRYWELGVPYLAWTTIYLVFSIVTVSASWDEVGRFLRHNVLLGFSQMYFVVIVFQFYLVFPLLLRLFRGSRHHGRIMTASLALAGLVDFLLHYPAWFGPLGTLSHSINLVWPWGRDLIVDQEFLIAGMLVALHLDWVVDVLVRRYRQVLFFTAVVGILGALSYMVALWSGESIAYASDVYDPTATVWSFAAIAGILALSLKWEQRSAGMSRSASRRLVPTSAYLAGLTGGVFFAHTLFINIIRATLDVTGLRTSLPWEAVVAILFVGTVLLTGSFVAVILHTPLRWVLGGPVRSEQRAADNAQFAELRMSTLRGASPDLPVSAAFQPGRTPSLSM